MQSIDKKSASRQLRAAFQPPNVCFSRAPPPQDSVSNRPPGLAEAPTRGAAGPARPATSKSDSYVRQEHHSLLSFPCFTRWLVWETREKVLFTIHGSATRLMTPLRLAGEAPVGISLAEGSPVAFPFGEGRVIGIPFGEGAFVGFAFDEPRETRSQQIHPRQTHFQQTEPRQTHFQQETPRQTIFQQITDLAP